MKRLLASAFCLCLLLSGCIQSGSTPTEPPLSLHFELRPATNTVTDDNGAEIFTLTYPELQLTHPDERVAEKIYHDLTSRIDEYRDDATDLVDTAREASQTQDDFVPWFANLEGQVTRLDINVLSIFFTYTVYCGGNHPNITTFSVTYNAKTGKAMLLSDILKEGHSEKELTSEVNRVLTPSANDLFDDYEALVGEQFAAGYTENWYLTENSLCFHYAPYAIAPYASGIVTAEISLTSLKDLLQYTYTN